MARQKKTSSSSNLAEEIKLWAATNGIVLNANLKLLIEDLESSTNLDRWASENIETLLPMPSLIKSARMWKKVNLVSNLRNVFVFSPVALTWASISVATSSLAKFELENPNRVTNFLQFWQNGYGYLNEFWKLSNVALLDFALVTVTILLTLIVGNWTKNANEIELIELEEKQQSRASLLLSINSFFYEFKYPTPNTINRNTFAATKSLAKSIKSLEKIMKKLEKDLNKYPDNRDLIKEIKSLNKELNKKKPK